MHITKVKQRQMRNIEFISRETLFYQKVCNYERHFVLILSSMYLKYLIYAFILTGVYNLLGFFMSFEKVMLMDEGYRICISIVSFIVIVDLLKHLTFNYHIHLMRIALKIYRTGLATFACILVFMVVAFASLLHLTRGNVESEFRSFYSTTLALFKIMIGMINMGKDIQVDNTITVVYFCLYAFLVTLMTINIFISGLNLAFSDAEFVSNIPGDDYFDKEVSDYLDWKIAYFLGFDDPFVPKIKKDEFIGDIENGNLFEKGEFIGDIENGKFSKYNSLLTVLNDMTILFRII